ncbi:AbiJ-NTD4 domain-containing protein [Leptospira interrogans]|uniref:AbiJ-NTD4 domain-containing protein n=1 Tax=Leptospira interrogans TaxID=173 RepID=UPI000B23E417|nr:hypothetical protein [Leptospira interrogans]
MNRNSFINRFSINQKALIYDQFPLPARNGLVHIITELLQRKDKENSKTEWEKISQCLHKANKQILYLPDSNSYRQQFNALLINCEWYVVYEFCEIYFSNNIEEYCVYYGGAETIKYTKEENQRYFTDEINALLASEYVGFEFKDGQFARRGYSKTQTTINKSNQVLAAPKLKIARKHYNKALKYFQSKEIQDAENSIKEAICALEATLNSLFSPNVASNFSKEVLKLVGGDENQAPRPLIDAMIKIYGYRNSASGVAHAPAEGLKVTFKEAELVLNLIGDYITYFYDLLYTDDEIPF